LSVSERVAKTYPNSKLKVEPNIANQKYNALSSKVKSSMGNFKFYFNSQILVRFQKIDITKLNSDEIIITSIIIGTVLALIFGYTFGETYYFLPNGNRGDESRNIYEEFHFNYLLGITSFIIIGGITYIYLNRKNKKNG
jgi:hypothetical protein